MVYYDPLFGFTVLPARFGDSSGVVVNLDGLNPDQGQGFAPGSNRFGAGVYRPDGFKDGDSIRPHVK